MRINYGAGRQVLEGFCNVDAVVSPKAPRPPEVLHDILTGPTPLPDGCADELMAIHFVEHVYHWQLPQVLAEFRRLLKPQGLLVLELPNLEAACRNVLAGMGDQMGMWPLYGDPTHKDPFMCHRWAYTPQSMTHELTAAGFYKVKVGKPRFHGARENRDMRLEAWKP